MHPFKSPTTVYVVVVTGFAVTEVPVELLSVVEGLQVYVFAPLAVRVVLCPMHTDAGGTVTFGWPAMVTVTCAVAVHPSASPVTVYVRVDAGVAVTVAPAVELNPVAGVHV